MTRSFLCLCILFFKVSINLLEILEITIFFSEAHGNGNARSHQVIILNCNLIKTADSLLQSYIDDF